MKVAAIQHDIVWEDPHANFRHLAVSVAGAAAAGARVALLSEMFSVGFSLEVERIAEAPDGPSVEFLRSQAAANDVWVGGSIPIRDPGAALPVNRFVLAGPAGEEVHYDKIHPFSYAREDEHYQAGSSFTTIDIDGVRVSLFVCYDLRFADEFWHLAPDTDCYLVPANWPSSRRLHWQSLLRARAIENQAYVIGVNRVGEGGGLSYSGDSTIIDPMGEVLASGAGTEALLIAEVDASVVAETRSRFPFLADRR